MKENRRRPTSSLLVLLYMCAGATVAADSSGSAVYAADAPGQGRGAQARSSTLDGAAVAPTGVVGNTLCLNAAAPDDPDTYRRIERVFGRGAVEAPSDAVYAPQRAHIQQLAGDRIVGPYFAFLAIDPTDVNLDLVPMTDGGDRSRTEIKIAPSKGGVHDAFKAREGDTYVYIWRFRIAPGMKFSPGFTHIHQIKAYGGALAEAPLITFTPLSNGKMDIRHVGNSRKNASAYEILGSISLAGIPGQWMDVREEITYSNTVGRYRLAIRDQGGELRLGLDKGGLQMWRTGAEHMRPKWGIYRKHHASLNQGSDDYVYFANFGITRGNLPDSACR